jgi:hypothetical protein
MIVKSTIVNVYSTGHWWNQIITIKNNFVINLVIKLYKLSYNNKMCTKFIYILCGIFYIEL